MPASSYSNKFYYYNANVDVSREIIHACVGEIIIVCGGIVHTEIR